MGNLIIILLVIWLIFGIGGFIIEGLLWLGLIGVGLFVVTLIWGWIKRNTKS